MAYVLPEEILKYEDEGLLLTPCKSDKTPAYRGWQELASSSRKEHEHWFAELGLLPGMLTGERNGIVVVDCDEKGIGRAFFKQFRERIRTIVETPRGVHFYFAQPEQEVGNRVKATIGGVLADFRSTGGYVVAPPAKTERGGYRFVDGFGLNVKNLEPFDPRWIAKKEPKRNVLIEEPDVLQRIYRATKWAEKAEAAVEHAGWHNKIFSFCCAMFQKFGLTIEQAYPIILIYASRCQPPICPKGLKHKIEDAWRKAHPEG